LTDIRGHLGQSICQPVDHAEAIFAGELPGGARKDLWALFDDLSGGLAVGQHEGGRPNNIDGRAGS
jgi:hypothetical protein